MSRTVTTWIKKRRRCPSTCSVAELVSCGELRHNADVGSRREMGHTRWEHNRRITCLGILPDHRHIQLIRQRTCAVDVRCGMARSKHRCGIYANVWSRLKAESVDKSSLRFCGAQSADSELYFAGAPHVVNLWAGLWVGLWISAPAHSGWW